MTVVVDGVEVDLTPRPRIRAPGDLLRAAAGAVVAAVGVVLALYARNTLGAAESDLAEPLSRLPSRWEAAVLGLAEVLTFVAVFTLAGWLAITRRWATMGWLALTSAVSAVGAVGLGYLLADNQVEVLRGADSVEEWLAARSEFPSSPLIAAAVAGVTFASPWLGSRWRRACWSAVVALVVMRVGLAADPSADLVAAIGIGVAVGSLALWWRGAPSLEPGGPDLIASLRAAGITPVSIQQRGAGQTSLRYLVATDDGSELFVRLHTPHERAVQTARFLWQTVRLRPDEVDQPFSSVQRRVEHDALVTVVAERGGVRVAHVRELLRTDDGAFGVAEDRIPAHRGDPADDPTAERLQDTWVQLRALHTARVAHRDLGLHQVLFDDDDHAWLTGFARARLMATERERALDVAQLLTDTALAVGPEAAVRAATTVLGVDPIAAALPLLQPLALPRPTRRRLKDSPGVLDDLRAAVVAQTGVEPAPLERIERVRPRTVVTIVALTLAFYLVLPQVADIRQTADAFVEADWAWAPLVLLGSALSYLAAAIAFVGAVPQAVPFLPALRAQLASSFVGLIAPANSGGLALGVRFLQRSGVDSPTAAAAVGLDAAAGLVVHLALMFVFILWNGSSGFGTFSLPDATLVLGILGVVLAVGGGLLLNKRIRGRVVGPALVAIRSAAGSVGAVLTNPLRVAQLFGGSVGITLAYLLAMIAAVQAFGGGISLTQVAVGYLVSSALASFAPTPGGLGAFEAAMITALTGFGMDSGAAVSATLSFRLATYWLPVPPGWAAFQWMQSHEEI